MADVARLMLSVDSSNVTQADRALASFNAQARITNNIMTQMRTANAQWGATANGIVAPISAINAQMKTLSQTTATASTGVKAANKDFTDIFRSLLNAREGVEGVIGGFLRLGTGAYLVTRALQTTVGIAVSMVKPFIENAAAVESMRASYGALLGSQEQGNSMVAFIQTLSTQIPITTKAMSEGTRTLIGFGFAANEVRSIMPKLAQVAQGNTEAFNHLAVVYGQVRAQGRMYMNDLRQFTNAGVPMIEALAEVVKAPQSEIANLIKDGRIGLEETRKALELLTDEGGRFHDTLTAATDTLNGQLTLAANNFKLTFADAGKGASTFVKNALQEFNTGAMVDRVNKEATRALLRNPWEEPRIAGTFTATKEQTLAAQTAYANALATIEALKQSPDWSDAANISLLTKSAGALLAQFPDLAKAKVRRTEAIGPLDDLGSMTDEQRRSSIFTKLGLLREKLDLMKGMPDFDTYAKELLDAFYGRYVGIESGLMRVPSTWTGTKAVGDEGAGPYQPPSIKPDGLIAELIRMRADDDARYGLAKGGARGARERSYGGLPNMLPYGGANDITRTNAGYGYYGYVEPPTNPPMPAPYVDPNSRYRSTGAVGQGVYQGAYQARFMGLSASTEFAQEGLTSLKESWNASWINSVVSTFDTLGKTLYTAANGGETFSETMSKIGADLTSTMGQLMTTLGLQILIKNVYDPIGWAFLAAGGVVSIVGGYWSASSSDTSSTAADLQAAADAMYKYYLAAEAFNRSSYQSANLTGFASGTDFAPGGMATVGERGTETVFLPRGSRVIPHFAGGVGSVGGVNIVINNNAPNTDVSTSVDESGQIIIAVEKTVKNAIATGKLDTVARSRWGVQYAGRAVSG